jgi:hypothetical protein
VPGDLDDAGHASTVPRAADIRPTPGPVADRQPRPAGDCSPVGAIRRLAYDRSLTPDDAMQRICDAFADHDGGST